MENKKKIVLTKDINLVMALQTALGQEVPVIVVSPEYIDKVIEVFYI